MEYGTMLGLMMVIVRDAVREFQAGHEPFVQVVPCVAEVVRVIRPPAFPLRPVDVRLGVAVDVEFRRDPARCLVEFAAVDGHAQRAVAVWAFPRELGFLRRAQKTITSR